MWTSRGYHSRWVGEAGRGGKALLRVDEWILDVDEQGLPLRVGGGGGRLMGGLSLRVVKGGGLT